MHLVYLFVIHLLVYFFNLLSLSLGYFYLLNLAYCCIVCQQKASWGYNNNKKVLPIIKCVQIWKILQKVAVDLSVGISTISKWYQRGQLKNIYQSTKIKNYEFYEELTSLMKQYLLGLWSSDPICRYFKCHWSCWGSFLYPKFLLSEVSWNPFFEYARSYCYNNAHPLVIRLQLWRYWLYL